MARTTKSQRRERKRIEAEQQRQEAARTKMIRTTAVGVVAVVVVVGLLFVGWPRKSDAEIAADFRGKPTVAAFFASWCEVCESEMPELLALSEEVGEDINFVGIDMMDNGDGLGDAEKWGLVGRWPLAIDIGNGNGSALSALTFGARGSPLNVLYSPDGEVVHVQLGAISRSQILQELSPYLQG